MKSAVTCQRGASLAQTEEARQALLAIKARVEASRPAVDVTTAAVNFTVGERFLQGLPTSRTFSDLLNLAPGVALSQATADIESVARTVLPA